MNKEDWIKNVIIVSGGFDPVHKGHIRMFREASNLGAQVIVGLNSDDWLTRKKDDDTAKDIIVKACKLYNNEDFNIYFANGGDRGKGNVPELETCKNLNVVMLWGIGGGKIQSSSWLINGEEK